MSDQSSSPPSGKKVRKKVDPRKVENCIYQIDSNLFEVKVSKRINGKPYTKRRRAIRFITPARQLRDQFIHELHILEQEIKHGNMKWKDAVEEYFENRQKEIELQRISYKTFDVQEKSIKKHTESWNNTRIADLHQSFIRQDLTSKFFNLRKATIKSNLKYLRLIFDFHLSKPGSCLKTNPITGLKIQGKIAIGGITAKSAMDSAEIEKLITHLNTVDSEWSQIIRFAFYTGMRSGELYALRFEDIEIDNLNDKKFIHVKRSYCFTKQEDKSPKNGTGRIVPINDSVEKILLQRKDQQKDGHVFSRSREWETGKAAEQLRKFQKDLGITETNFHSLRSAFITEMLLNGCVPAILQEIVGHADYKTTQVYVQKVQTAKNLKGLTQMIEVKSSSNIAILNPNKKSG